MTMEQQCKGSTAGASEAYVAGNGSQKSKGAGERGKMSNLTCYYCQKPGHMKRECLKGRKILWKGAKIWRRRWRSRL
jgi:hypothetical protein